MWRSKASVWSWSDLWSHGVRTVYRLTTVIWRNSLKKSQDTCRDTLHTSRSRDRNRKWRKEIYVYIKKKRKGPCRDEIHKKLNHEGLQVTQNTKAVDVLRRDRQREKRQTDWLVQSRLQVRDRSTHRRRHWLRLTGAQRQRSTEEHMGDSVMADTLSRPSPTLTLTIA